ncbi:uncharacterized [Tachysurus ichikawai]
MKRNESLSSQEQTFPITVSVSTSSSLSASCSPSVLAHIHLARSHWLISMQQCALSNKKSVRERKARKKKRGATKATSCLPSHEGELASV